MKIRKTILILSAILLLAFILRVIAAVNTDVSTDEMIYTIIPLNIISAGRLGTVEQSPLFFNLEDISYQLFGGITPFSIRFWAIMFGTLACAVIFLITLELFDNEKAALFAAFLAALSGYSLKFNIEMDIIAFFFVLLSMLFFLRFLKSNTKYLYASATFFALAIMTKNIVALFIPAYLIVWWWHRKQDKKTIVLSIALSLLTLTPIFAYNYLTYSESGTTDYYFSNILGIGESVHKGQENKPWEFSRLISISQVVIGKLFRFDSILMILGLASIPAALKKNRNSAFFLLSALLLFLYIAGQTGSPTHFIWLPLALSICGGYGIEHWSQKAHAKGFKWLPTLIIAAMIITSLITTVGIIRDKDKSITLSLRNYVNQNIPDNAIVVLDPRIYRGIHAWVFNDKHYIDGPQFFDLANQIESFPGKTKIPVYYVECGKGTYCGWKPEDFERINDVGEQISDYFRKNAQKAADIQATHHFIIYKGEIQAPRAAYDAIDRTHNFWFYPVGWKFTDNVIDNYTPRGFGTIINALGFLILYADIAIALFSIPLTTMLIRGVGKKSENGGTQ